MKYRLWIKPDGTPLYVECREELDPDALDFIRDTLDQIKGTRPVFLGPDWELSVLA